MGIEPTSQAWEARILPMYYTRKSQCYYTTILQVKSIYFKINCLKKLIMQKKCDIIF